MRDMCPCGSGVPEAACCGKYHRGAPAPTAVALMRSRYTAYVRGEIDYLLATHDAATRGKVDVEAIRRWARETTWLGLEIVDTVAGGEGDDTGIVEFVARGATGGRPFVQRERSRFRRVDGQWRYVDGTAGGEPARRVASVGRNDPCPCGSGMKYKRCHGA
ncbi:MAG TPA: YchJ family protein [Kofleriaceae bacterium]|nr:YchJ family protein [Kofleriaceae bacterium]